jgi:hypothetical protein
MKQQPPLVARVPDGDEDDSPAPRAEKTEAMIDINTNVGIYTLLISAVQLSQLDRHVGYEKRRSDLDKLAKEYLKTFN